MSHTKRNVLIIAAIGVLLLGGAGAVFYTPIRNLFSHNQQSQTTSNTPTAQQVYVNRIDQATALIAKGDTAGALALYDKAIQETSDKNERQSLLITKASLAMDAKQYDQALSTIAEADKLGSNATTLGYTARIYEAKGDKADALVYYQKAVTLLQSQTGQKRSSVALDAYQAKIKELQASK